MALSKPPPPHHTHHAVRVLTSSHFISSLSEKVDIFNYINGVSSISAHSEADAERRVRPPRLQTKVYGAYLYEVAKH